MVRYKNVTDLHYRIIKVNREEVQSQRRKWERKYDVDQEQKFLEYFLPKVPIKSGKFVLPDDKDYQQHSLEVKTRCTASWANTWCSTVIRPDFAIEENGLAYAFTTVSNISYIHRSVKDGSTELYVLHRKSGEPLAGVLTEVFASKYNSRRNEYELVKIGSYTSDAKGYVRIPYQTKDDNRSFSFNFSLRTDRISTTPIDRGSYYNGGIYQYREVKRKISKNLFPFGSCYIVRPNYLF